jgi:hypothetical protein
MKKLEHRVLRALIFFTIMLFGYQLMFAIFLPFLAPPEFLNNFKFIGFTITFFGLHTFLALCTFIFSRLPISNQLSLVLLIASIVIPLAYLINNISYIMNLNISNIIVVLFSTLIYDFIRKDPERNHIRKYIRVLINPFYLEDEIF